MEDKFQKTAAKNFEDLLKDFLMNLKTIFMDCEKIDTKLENLEILSDYRDVLFKTLPKKVKYSKALERILNTSPLFYHACEYNDIDGISQVEPDFLNIDIFEKYKTMTDSDKKIFWKYINELNTLCFKSFNEKPPYVPTRDEINKNIKTKKGNSTLDQPSMNKAFITALSNLCSMTNNSDITQNKSETEMQTLMKRWNEYSKDNVDNKKITTLCNQKHVAAFHKLNEHFEEFVLEDTCLSDELWNTIIQLNGYSAVGENIPTKMMGKIETLASRLADDIMNGRADLSSMNLTDIGQEVLSQCDESDMNNFANNIENLIPALQSFQKAMPNS
mgnify:CR=1 FL=1